MPRYTIQIGITLVIVEGSTTAVESARAVARTLSAESGAHEIAYVYQSVAASVVASVGARPWRPYEAYQDGRRMALAHDTYPPCQH